METKIFRNLKNFVQYLKHTMYIFIQKKNIENLQSQRTAFSITKQHLDQSVYFEMNQMALELFEALRFSKLHMLHSIQAPSDFRITNYLMISNQMVYIFELNKLQLEPLSVYHIRSIQNNIQQDLTRFRVNLFQNYTPSHIQEFFPFTYKQIIVKKVQDVGTAIQIYFTT